MNNFLLNAKEPAFQAEIILFMVLAASLLVLPSLYWSTASAAAGTFTFGASGDIGISKASDASLTASASAGLAFFLVVGDFSYNGTGTEQSWCSFVTSHMGSNFPFELEGGNHEADTGPDGRVSKFAACLPNRILNPDGSSAIVESGLCGASPVGCYAHEYYFDYPTDHPIARFIMVGADNTLDGVKYTYTAGNPHYQWLDSVIKQAKGQNPALWVIVGMHKVCLSAGVMQCAIGPDLARLLINDGVDIVLQGHDHLYERSKQLTCIGGAPARTVDASYDPSCVSNDGSNGIYPYGQGTVFLVNGQFGGRAFVDFNCQDPEVQYFAKGMGRLDTWDNGNCSQVDGVGNGFSAYTVSPNSIDVSLVIAKQTKNGSLYTDHWTIVRGVSGQPGPGCIPFVNCPASSKSGLLNGPDAAIYLLIVPVTATIVAAMAILILRRKQAFDSKLTAHSQRGSRGGTGGRGRITRLVSGLSSLIRLGLGWGQQAPPPPDPSAPPQDVS